MAIVPKTGVYRSADNALSLFLVEGENVADDVFARVQLDTGAKNGAPENRAAKPAAETRRVRSEQE